jgi:hypothetical protein
MRRALWFAVALLALFIGGCGGTHGSSTVSLSSPYNGIYRTAFTRGTSAITVYMNYPLIEIVVTDEAGVFPSYVGKAANGVTNVGLVPTFSSVTLTGSDGETAVASGTFGTSSTGPENVVNITLTGGIGLSTQIPISTTNTNTLDTGTYSGSFQSTYTANNVVTTPPQGSVSQLTLSPDLATGGYDLSATGNTIDPLGVAVQFTINDAQVDPCGIIGNLSVTYTYTNGTNPVTNTFSSAYLNLGVDASTTLVGYMQATSTGWGNGATEADTMVLTQTSASGLAHHP